MSRPPSHTAHTRPITEALGANEALGRLMERLRESQARFAAIRPALPTGLWPWVRPGVLDEESWNLVVPNSAAAAKLRQMLPTLEQVLVESGWPRLDIRIKVRSDST